MGKLWWLTMHFQVLGVLSNIGDAVSKFFGTGDYDATKIQNAYNTLDNVRPYLHFNDAVGQIFNWMRWGVLKILYNLANGAQQVSTQALDYRKLLDSAGIKEQYQSYVLGASTAIMVAMLVWIGAKYMLGREKVGVQHIIMQVVISIFLMLNISTITNWVADQASGFYSTAISEKDGTKYSNSIPFDLVAKNTNDLMYMYASNWKGYGTKENGKIKTQYREHFGNNGWLEDGKATDDGQDMFEQLSANDLAMSITPDQADIMQKELDKYAKQHGWSTEKVRPEYLKYRLVDGGDKPAAIKISKSNIPFSNAFSGGYSRYTVAFLPVAFCLACLTFAFFFITYLVIKTFLDMAIMQIIGVVVFSTDLESGQKTKAVVQDIFTSAITLCCQAVELMFYRIVIDWIIKQDFASKGLGGIALECMGFLAMTILLVSGSQKTTKFFGVDTGAQKGYTAAALAVNQTMSAAKKAGAGIIGTGKGVAKVAKGGYNFAMDSVAKGDRTLNGLGKAKDVYKQRKQESAANGTPMKLSDKAAALGAGALAGYHASKAEKDTRKDFLKSGGSRYEWESGAVRGMTQAATQARADRYDKNRMKDSAYESLRGQVTPYPSAVRDQNEGYDMRSEAPLSPEDAAKQARSQGKSPQDIPTTKRTDASQVAGQPTTQASAPVIPIKRTDEDASDQGKISSGKPEAKTETSKNPKSTKTSETKEVKSAEAKDEKPTTSETKPAEKVVQDTDNQRKLSEDKSKTSTDKQAKTDQPVQGKQTTQSQTSEKQEPKSAEENDKYSDSSQVSKTNKPNKINPEEARKLSDKPVNKAGSQATTDQGTKIANAPASPKTTETSTTSTGTQAPTGETRKFNEKPEVKKPFKPTEAPQQAINSIARQKADKFNVKVDKDPAEIKKTYQEGTPKISETKKIAKGRSLEDITKGKQLIKNKNVTAQGDTENVKITRQNQINKDVEDVTKMNEKVHHLQQNNPKITEKAESKIKQAPKHGDFKGKDE